MVITRGRVVGILILATVVGISLGVFDPAYAGPGGIVKAVTTSFWGQVGLCLLGIILFPLVVWFYILGLKRSKKIRSELTRLAAVYPQYHWLDLRDRATEIYLWVWSAWSQQKMSLASQYTTSWYWQNQQLVLDRWEADGQINICKVDCILSIDPLFIEHREENNCEGSRVVLSIKANVMDYLEDKATGKVVKGDKKCEELETIWTLKWQEGAWRLNLIEPDTQEFEYLGMPSMVPEVLAGRSAELPGTSTQQ